jgi:hypothetical protein
MMEENLIVESTLEKFEKGKLICQH